MRARSQGGRAFADPPVTAEEWRQSSIFHSSTLPVTGWMSTSISGQMQRNGGVA